MPRRRGGKRRQAEVKPKKGQHTWLATHGPDSSGASADEESTDPDMPALVSDEQEAAAWWPKLTDDEEEEEEEEGDLLCTSWEALPAHVVLRSLTFVDVEDRARAAGVSRGWRGVVARMPVGP